ncbi:collagen alpha-1(IV) chain-like [Armigeres subalbatus]|uniref:collagen alpha-1(IV) chain-like n=1 Tax=Armigeres subalbatus TaxID=124917 RepID=UPI002ED02E4F
MFQRFTVKLLAVIFSPLLVAGKHFVKWDGQCGGEKQPSQWYPRPVAVHFENACYPFKPDDGSLDKAVFPGQRDMCCTCPVKPGMPSAYPDLDYLYEKPGPGGVMQSEPSERKTGINEAIPPQNKPSISYQQSVGNVTAEKSLGSTIEPGAPNESQVTPTSPDIGHTGNGSPEIDYVGAETSPGSVKSEQPEASGSSTGPPNGTQITPTTSDFGHADKGSSEIGHPGAQTLPGSVKSGQPGTFGSTIEPGGPIGTQVTPTTPDFSHANKGSSEIGHPGAETLPGSDKPGQPGTFGSTIEPGGPNGTQLTPTTPDFGHADKGSSEISHPGAETLPGSVKSGQPGTFGSTIEPGGPIGTQVTPTTPDFGHADKGSSEIVHPGAETLPSSVKSGQPGTFGSTIEPGGPNGTQVTPTTSDFGHADKGSSEIGHPGAQTLPGSVKSSQPGTFGSTIEPAGPNGTQVTPTTPDFGHADKGSSEIVHPGAETLPSSVKSGQPGTFGSTIEPGGPNGTQVTQTTPDFGHADKGSSEIGHPGAETLPGSVKSGQPGTFGSTIEPGGPNGTQLTPTTPDFGHADKGSSEIGHPGAETLPGSVKSGQPGTFGSTIEPGGPNGTQVTPTTPDFGHADKGSSEIIHPDAETLPSSVKSGQPGTFGSTIEPGGPNGTQVTPTTSDFGHADKGSSEIGYPGAQTLPGSVKSSQPGTFGSTIEPGGRNGTQLTPTTPDFGHADKGSSEIGYPGAQTLPDSVKSSQPGTFGSTIEPAGPSGTQLTPTTPDFGHADKGSSEIVHPGAETLPSSVKSGQPGTFGSTIEPGGPNGTQVTQTTPDFGHADKGSSEIGHPGAETLPGSVKSGQPGTFGSTIEPGGPNGTQLTPTTPDFGHADKGSSEIVHPDAETLPSSVKSGQPGTFGSTIEPGGPNGTQVAPTTPDFSHANKGSSEIGHPGAETLPGFDKPGQPGTFGSTIEPGGPIGTQVTPTTPDFGQADKGSSEIGHPGVETLPESVKSGQPGTFGSTIEPGGPNGTQLTPTTPDFGHADKGSSEIGHPGAETLPDRSTTTNDNQFSQSSDTENITTSTPTVNSFIGSSRKPYSNRRRKPRPQTGKGGRRTPGSRRKPGSTKPSSDIGTKIDELVNDIETNKCES